VESAAQNFARQLQGWIQQGGHQSTEIIGPVPCFFARVSGIYRWQVILRGPDPAAILRHKNLGQVRVEVNPPSLL
jgi:primosomal protein N' (replication factor Y)